MNATTRPTVMYETIHALAERERSIQIEASLQADAFLQQCALAPEPELHERQVFEWVNSPEAIACAVMIALFVVGAVCAGWL